MVKYYLKNTDKEVKVGDRITISVPTSTPYGQAKCDIEVLVTQETLNQLVEDNLVDKREEQKINFEYYEPFIRRIARKHDITFHEACEFLDNLKDISVHAHNAVMLEAMADVFNGDKVVGISNWVWIINAHGEVGSTQLQGIVNPFFIDQKDAIRALSLLKPFLSYYEK
jgi:hypothetical protein